VHRRRAEQQHVGAVLLDRPPALVRQPHEHLLLLAGEERLEVGRDVHRPDGRALLLEVVEGEVLLVEVPPLVPHGDDREALPEHRPDRVGDEPRAEHRDREARAERPQPRVGDGVHDHRVEAFVLRAEAGLGDEHVEDQILVVAVDQRRAVPHGDALDLRVGAEDVARDLGRAVRDAFLVERERDDVLDPQLGPLWPRLEERPL
jgi:hypothetical protein